MKKEIITDGSIKYTIDFDNGQKTGFYFDQRDNRYFIENIVKGKNVLDGFCNSGGFGLHAAKAGASKVLFIDSSETEIENTKITLKRTGLNVRLNILLKMFLTAFFALLVNKKNMML